jgi:hypothetical protein
MLTILAIAALLSYQKPETVVELAEGSAKEPPQQKPSGYG